MTRRIYKWSSIFSGSLALVAAMVSVAQTPQDQAVRVQNLNQALSSIPKGRIPSPALVFQPGQQENSVVIAPPLYPNAPKQSSGLAAPAVRDIIPNPARNMQGPQPLTITGSGFITTSRVELNDTSVSNAVRSAKILTITGNAIVLSANLGTEDHVWTARVINPDGKASNYLPIRIGFSNDAAFAASASSNPNSGAAATSSLPANSSGVPSTVPSAPVMVASAASTSALSASSALDVPQSVRTPGSPPLTTYAAPITSGVASAYPSSSPGSYARSTAPLSVPQRSYPVSGAYEAPVLPAQRPASQSLPGANSIASIQTRPYAQGYVESSAVPEFASSPSPEAAPSPTTPNPSAQHADPAAAEPYSSKTQGPVWPSAFNGKGRARLPAPALPGDPQPVPAGAMPMQASLGGFVDTDNGIVYQGSGHSPEHLKPSDFERDGNALAERGDGAPNSSMDQVVKPELTTSVIVSNRDVNRIACDSDVTDVIWSQERPVKITTAGNNVFVKYMQRKLGEKVSFVTDPVDLHIVCNGNVYTIVLRPQQIDSVTVRLLSPVGKIVKKIAKDWNGLALEEKIQRLTLMLYRDDAPEGFNFRPMNNADERKHIQLYDANGGGGRVMGDVEIVGVADLSAEGTGLRATEYALYAHHAREFQETDFLKREFGDVVGITIDPLRLNAGQRARLIVVTRSVEHGS